MVFSCGPLLYPLKRSLAMASASGPVSTATGEGEGMEGKLSTVEKMVVYDGEGKEVEFGSLYQDQKVILVFIREYVQDLAKVPPASLEAVSVDLVVIGCAPHKFIKTFRARTGYEGALYCDPRQAVYSSLGMIRTLATGVKSSEHVKSSSLGGSVKSTFQALKSLELQGDVKQQGGSFVIGPGSDVHFSHLDSGSLDHSPINTLLEAAGIEKVDFSKK